MSKIIARGMKRKLSLEGRVSGLAEREGGRCLTGDGSRSTVLTEAVPHRRRPMRWPGAWSRAKVEYSFVDISSREPRDLRRLERGAGRRFDRGCRARVVQSSPGMGIGARLERDTGPRRRRLAAEALPGPARSSVARSRIRRASHRVRRYARRTAQRMGGTGARTRGVHRVQPPRAHAVPERVSEAIWTLRPLW